MGARWASFDRSPTIAWEPHGTFFSFFVEMVGQPTQTFPHLRPRDLTSPEGSLSHVTVIVVPFTVPLLDC